ncbi:MAG: glutathione S-transferase N-terminal domain-containing protein [Pseudomonadota bacterium]
MYTLTIGDKAYSSWSMRGWLLLAGFGIKFEEELVPMYSEAFDAMQAANAPARTVPQLSFREGGEQVRIWDTLAIAETLAERHAAAGIWPQDRRHRAVARCLVAEMHSGFAVLRGCAPMNIHRDQRPLQDAPEGLGRDLDRLATLWDWAREETGGPWLGGASFSAADVFYAPVASRLQSYALATESTNDYVTQLLAHEAVDRWYREARADPRRVALYEDIP